MPQGQIQEKYYSLKCGVASFAAKYVVAILHPLELLKTRFQSHDGKLDMNQVPKYKGIFQGISSIYKTEGFKGLYKGVHISAFISAFASFIFFSIYQKQKLYLEKQGLSTMMATAYAGTVASIVTTLTTQPVWVIKTRVLLNTQKKIGQFENIRLKTKQIWAQQRFKGFAKGLSLNLILSSGGALRVYVYEGVKILFQRFISKQYQGFKHLVSGGISKLVTTLISYPLTTIRTRIQQNQYHKGVKQAKYKNILDIAIKLIKDEGVLGFYKGLSPNLLRGIPMRSMYFFSYQKFKTLLIDQRFLKREKRHNVEY